MRPALGCTVIVVATLLFWAGFVFTLMWWIL